MEHEKFVKSVILRLVLEFHDFLLLDFTIIVHFCWHYELNIGLKSSHFRSFSAKCCKQKI